MKQTFRMSLGLVVMMAWLACQRPVHSKSPVATSIFQATETTPTEQSQDTACLDPTVRKPRTIYFGILNSKAIDIPKPVYPVQAKDAKISGVVKAGVVIDETGKVIWARVETGHPLLQAAVKTVVCQARVKPIRQRASQVTFSLPVGC
ncbi:MAG: TonB family protein [Pyrinomonadaceae bacterium]